MLKIVTNSVYNNYAIIALNHPSGHLPTDAEVGFEASEFTVVEGERAFLKIVLKNSELNPHDYKRWQSAFTATIGRGHGNATGESLRVHGITVYMAGVFPGRKLKTFANLWKMARLCLTDHFY